MIGLLSEIGHVAEDHDAGIKQIKATTIETIIDAVCDRYFRLYSQTAQEINCGNCESFAHDVVGILGSGEVFWHEELLDCSKREAAYWSHCFILYNGKAYDSETPKGVNRWRDLPCFRNNPLADTE